MTNLPDSRGGSKAEQEDRRQARAWGRSTGVGLQFAASVVFFFFLGRWIDGRFGTSPWGVLVGVFGGTAAAFYGMYHRLMRDLERDEKERKG
jgi:F0F1-type ATP synthase assembly protein I